MPFNPDYKPKETRKKSYQARKNAGNNLFFEIIHNILSSKSTDEFFKHLDNPTFDDVYTMVGVEKALGKCFDLRIVKALVDCQTDYTHMTQKSVHYYFLMKKLPATYKGIDWRLDDKITER